MSKHDAIALFKIIAFCAVIVAFSFFLSSIPF
jgi:hypothetical protein